MISKKVGFSLVELMIVITIMVMMMILSYIPYSYLQNRAKIKISSSLISQSISEGRNLAISGVKTDIGLNSGNKSIGVFFNNLTGKNGKIYFYTYPYDTDVSSINKPSSNDELLKTRDLQDGVLINGATSKLFFFEAISGKISIIEFDGNTSKILTGSIGIDFSFNNSKVKTLNKTINYETETNTFNFGLGKK